MADATFGQVIELLYKRSREEMQLLAKIASGEIDREDLQQMITESKRSPQERLARAFLKKAESALNLNYDPSLSTQVFAKMCAVYELLDEGAIADKMTYRAHNNGLIYLERIKALCEKRDFNRARKLVTRIFGQYDQQEAWLAIADASGEQGDYDRITAAGMPVMTLYTRIRVAQSHAKTDGAQELQNMRNEAEKRIGDEYWLIVAALAQDYIRQGLFPQARVLIQQLDGKPCVGDSLQSDTALALAKASKNSRDIAMYKEFITTAHRDLGTHYLDYARCLAHIATLTGKEEDFAACRKVIEHDLGPHDQGIAYSALALAYAQCGNIPLAREIADTKISCPCDEAMTFARMARIVLSQPD